MKSLLKEKILHSGLIFTGISFVVGGGNFFLQGIIRRNLTASGEFGWAGATELFTTLLGLPLMIAITAITHHVAHFSGSGDEARLNGLLVGCRRFLLKFTLALSVLGVLLIQPLTRYFEIPRQSLMLTALAGLFIGLWSGYAMALAQGMGWFKRVALIGLVAVAVKILFAWAVTSRYPVAEAGGIALAGARLVLGRGPCDRDAELALLRRHRVDVVVCKASGGTATRAKLDAARALGLTVVMIRRPKPPPGRAVATPAAALAWAARTLGLDGDPPSPA